MVEVIASTYLEVDPNTARDRVLNALRAASAELQPLHGNALPLVEVKAGPGKDLIEVVMHFSKWDEDYDEDFVTQYLESIIETGKLLDRIDIQDSLFVDA